MVAHLPLLLAGGFTCLLGLGVSGFVLLRTQDRERAWSARREQTIGPYLKPKASNAPAIMISMREPQDKGDLLSRIPKIFGWREERRSQYPMTWWLLAIVMVAPSIIMALLATKLIGAAGWIAVPFVDLILTRTVLGYVANKISTQLLSQFPDALSMIARSVRVGVPVNEAVRVVAKEGLTPTREEFTRAADAMMIGVDIERALTDMAERNQLAEYRFFATALALQSQTGGGLDRNARHACRHDPQARRGAQARQRAGFRGQNQHLRAERPADRDGRHAVGVVARLHQHPLHLERRKQAAGGSSLLAMSRLVLHDANHQAQPVMMHTPFPVLPMMSARGSAR